MKEIKNVLICGIGAVGSIYANIINQSETANLRVLVDEKRFENYRKNPKIFNGKELILNYVLPQDTTFKADLIIIATKYDGLSEAVQNIKNFVKEDTVIMSLLNGVTSEEIIASEYGWRHVLLSYFIGHSAMRNGNNITHDGIGSICFGVKDKNLTSTQDIQIVKNFFDEVGIDYKIPDDMYRALWLKFLLNVSSNQISAILKMTFGQMQSNKSCRKLLKNIMEEVVAVAKLEGVKNTGTMVDEAFEIFASMSANGKTSMLQDVEAGRITEVDMFSTAVIELGKKHNIQTPYNKIIKEMIDVIHDNY